VCLASNTGRWMCRCGCCDNARGCLERLCEKIIAREKYRWSRMGGRVRPVLVVINMPTNFSYRCAWSRLVLSVDRRRTLFSTLPLAALSESIFASIWVRKIVNGWFSTQIGRLLGNAKVKRTISERDRLVTHVTCSSRRSCHPTRCSVTSGMAANGECSCSRIIR
jgi:hypothetical protein